MKAAIVSSQLLTSKSWPRVAEVLGDTRAEDEAIARAKLAIKRQAGKIKAAQQRKREILAKAKEHRDAGLVSPIE